MTISFDTIPDTLVPFTYFEFAPAPTPFTATLKCLLVGHAYEIGTPPGNAVENTPYALSQGNVDSLFGRGSMLSGMYTLAKKNYPFAELWGIAVSPDVGALSATATVTVAHEPVRNGNLTFHIAGRRVACAVRAADTKASLASRIASTINADPYHYCRATINGSDDSIINLRCNWKGMSGQFIQVTLRQWGEDEGNMASLLLTRTAFLNAAGNSNIAGALGSVGDAPFNVYAIGVQGVAGQLDAAEEFLNDQSGRWSPYHQTYGHAIFCRKQTYAELVTFGLTRNFQHISVLGVEGSETPPWEFSAAVAAHVTGHLAIPPEMSRPLQTLELRDVQPSPDAIDWFDHDERQGLLAAGISVARVDDFGRVLIDRIVTTYKANIWGDLDPSYRDIETMYQNEFFGKYLRQRITSTYPRAALTDTPKNINNFVSPPQLFDLCVQVYFELEQIGLVENGDLFAKVLRVERNALNANRVDFLVPIDVVNQFRMAAVRVESNLQLRDAAFNIAA